MVKIEMESDHKGSIGKHDWCLGGQCEDGFPVFVDDRQLACRSSIKQGREYALNVIERLVADGDYRLNDKPAGFLPLPGSDSERKMNMKTYSLRAECESDATQLMSLITVASSGSVVLIEPGADGLPDQEIEIRTELTFDELVALIRAIPDSHVMLQTLEAVPLAQNSLERDYDRE